MTQEKIPINRTLVGILALICLGAGIYLLINDPNNEMWSGAFMRVGMVMSAFWLALPSGGRQAAWAKASPSVIVGMIVALFAVARLKWAAIPIIVGIAILGVFIRPRDKHQPGTKKY